MPKHPEDGPINEQDAKAKADKLLADPRHHGRPDQVEQTREDKFEGHDALVSLDPAWRKSGDDWVHAEEG